MVAEVADDMSARLSTFFAVVHTIDKSVFSEIWSTYHTSSSNYCPQDMALRPWHCAQPVMPGRTS